MSVRRSVFVDFANIFIGYMSNNAHRNYQWRPLSWFDYGFFFYAFPRYLLKPTLFILFKFDSCFFSRCSLTCLVFHKLYLSWHVSWHSQVVIILSEKEKSTGYSCTWICFDIYLNISIFVTRITKLRRARRSELALRSADFSCIRKPNFCSSLKGWYWSQISPDYKIREERCTQIRREVILTLSVVNRV